MAENVMSLQLKLMLQKNNIVIITILTVIVFVAGTILVFSVNSCGLVHIEITNDLKSYEQSLDPEFCAELLDSIITFNKQCSNDIDIIDCG